MYICIQKLSLEREVDQMLNDMMQKEGWTRSYALSVLRSKFESEERHQEVSYVDDLIRRDAEEQEEDKEGLAPIVTTTTTNTNTLSKEATMSNEPEVTTRKPSKVAPPPTRQQKQRQETTPSKFISTQLDKQTVQINKQVTQLLQ